MDAEADEGEISAVRPLRTYDEILSDVGYSTEYHGKWHAPVNYFHKYKNKVLPMAHRKIIMNFVTNISLSLRQNRDS